jgi:SAM-dependent methyltransferase
MKDNFSSQSDLYALYRPSYPDAFFTYLKTVIPSPQTAWDCGTGNGQVAIKLASLFDTVYATDSSPSQIENAIQLPNILYSVQPAEQTSFENDTLDFIIVAQAIHWFDFDKFYQEVLRTAKNKALLAVIGYGRLEISPEIDHVITNFYKDVIGSYWDAERNYIDELYQTIPFPFEELAVPNFNNRYEWTFEHLIGYLSTWSAVKHYIRANGKNPINLIAKELEIAFGKNKTRAVNFPLLIRMGRIIK